MLWLLAIGLVHSYLIWVGDILVLYAECGLLLYFFRNLRPRTLIIIGILALLVLVPIDLGFAALADSMSAAAKRVERRSRPVKSRARATNGLPKSWNEGFGKYVSPTALQEEKDWKRELAAYRGNYRGIVRFRAPFLFFLQTFGAVFFGMIFMAIGRMLIGMGLMKLGVFSGERSRQFYIRMVAVAMELACHS